MKYLLLAILFISTLSVSGQYRRDQPVTEIMGGPGGIVILGDIGNFGVGLGFMPAVRYRFNQNISVRGSLYASLPMGSDKGSDNESRGLKYRSINLEPSAQLEYTFFKLRRGYNRWGNLITKPQVRPYLFGGIGAVYFNPKVEDADFNPVDAEFSKITWTALGGFGLLYSIDRYWMLGGELGGRYLTTDYIDGYSPSASKANDLYYSGSLHIIYKIESKTHRRRW
jgi:hypothetical protein